MNPLAATVGHILRNSAQRVLSIFGKEVTKMREEITLQDYERAEAEIRANEGRMSFYIHAAVYVLVNILLLVINLVYIPEVLWFFYPLIGWGIGLTMHFLFAVLWVRSGTEGWQAKVVYRARALHAPQASVA
jgi:2TM domain